MTFDSIAELLATTPRSIEKGIQGLFGCYYSHVPEVTDILNYVESYSSYDDVLSDIEIHEFHHLYIDPRRYHSLFGVKFKDQWVMICRNAGREGDDHSSRYVLDKALYGEMAAQIIAALSVIKLKSVLADPPEYYGQTEEVSIDGSVENLYVFYGNDIRNPYRYW